MATIQAKVTDALLNGTTRVTRRAEIYESDGVTLFADSVNTPRIIDGNVTVDMGRDERRALDVTFDNADGLLRHDPEGFWYDKVIKIFRGTEWAVDSKSPSIAVIQDDGGSLISGIRRLGYSDVTLMTASVYGDVADYDIVIANGGISAISAGNLAILKQAYDAGQSVLTISDEATTGHPLITTTVAKSDAAAWTATPVSTDNYFRNKFSTISNSSTSTGRVPSVLAAGVVAVASYTWSATVYNVMFYSQNTKNGRWFHSQLFYNSNANGPYNQLLNSVIGWLFAADGLRTWETQVGEFCIDRINQPRFPRQIKVTGRDYTKRLLKSKISQAMSFGPGTLIDTIVGAVAANAGLTKLNLNGGGAALDSTIGFDRTTERWAIIKGVCAAGGLEAYFDPAGYLTTRPMQDPSTSPASLILATGSVIGNLVDYEKSSNDGRLYNRVIVTSENQDALVENPFGLQVIVANTEPSSPTRTQRIGNRDYFFTSNFFTNTNQMETFTQRLLRVTALEEFELNFSAVPFYWSDAGDILEFQDPDAGVDEPTRYLLSNFNIPLGLGPMSGVGKRVTIVGQAA